MCPPDCESSIDPLDPTIIDQVPLDHSEPDGLKAAIALIRKPSTYLESPASYRGPILFNPGGPGGSGVDLVMGLAGDLLSTIVGPEFDVVGFDPRGTHVSTSERRLSLIVFTQGSQDQHLEPHSSRMTWKGRFGGGLDGLLSIPRMKVSLGHWHAQR